MTGFSSESAMVQDYLNTPVNEEKILAGVVFNKMPPVWFSVEYKLRFPSTLRTARHKISLNPFDIQDQWMTRYMFPALQRVGPRKNLTQGGPPGR